MQPDASELAGLKVDMWCAPMKVCCHGIAEITPADAGGHVLRCLHCGKPLAALGGDAERFILEAIKHFGRPTEPIVIAKSSDRILRAMVAYARRGIAVMPLWWPTDVADSARCACGHPGCSSIGKHPLQILVPQGIKQATVDETVIRGWFKRFDKGRPNIGVVCGSISSIVVVDVDGSPGRQTLDKLLTDYRTTIPERNVVSTGRIDGGAHHYFALPDGITIKTRKLNGLEVRGEGTYVVAPPSMHHSGKQYEWVNGPSDVFDPLPQCFIDFAARVWPPEQPSGQPDYSFAERLMKKRLVEATMSPTLAEAKIKGAIRKVLEAKEGERNSLTYWAACRLAEMVAMGVLQSDTAVALIVEAAGRVGLPAEEARRTAESALRGEGVT